jgi:hypothetical protein
MDLASRLLGREFYDLFQKTVAALADRMSMNWNIDYDLLADAAEQWKNETDRAAIDETNVEQFVIILLGNIALAICEVNCTTYSSRPEPEGDVEAFHQPLLEEFAPEYTAMEFARARYMEFYFAIRGMPHVQLEPALVNDDRHTVASVLRGLRRDPQLAKQFVNLLHLPPFFDSNNS